MAPSASKLAAWFDYILIDGLCSTTGLITLAVLTSFAALWYFRATIQKAWTSGAAAAAPPTPKDKYFDKLWANALVRAAERGGVRLPAGGEGGSAYPPPNGQARC